MLIYHTLICSIKQEKCCLAPGSHSCSVFTHLTASYLADDQNNDFQVHLLVSESCHQVGRSGFYQTSCRGVGWQICLDPLKQVRGEVKQLFRWQYVRNVQSVLITIMQRLTNILISIDFTVATFKSCKCENSTS